MNVLAIQAACPNTPDKNQQNAEFYQLETGNARQQEIRAEILNKKRFLSRRATIVFSKANIISLAVEV